MVRFFQGRGGAFYDLGEVLKIKVGFLRLKLIVLRSR